MTDKITFHEATWTDIPGIDECNRAVLTENYDRKIYEQILAPGMSSSQVALNPEGTVIGYGLCIVRKERARPHGELMSIAVLPEYRCRGIGRTLIERSTAPLLQRNIPVQLHVRKTNKAAQKLYMRLGYGRKKKVPRYYDDGEDAFVMIREP